MRRYLLIALLAVTSKVWAMCPQYTHQDPLVNQEFQVLCHDMQFPIISTGTAQNFTIVRGTITNLTVTNIVSATVLGKVKQIVISSTTTNGSTTSTSFSDMGLSAAITPTSLTSQILIYAQGSCDENTNGGEGTFTILRATLNLGDATTGMAKVHNFGTRVYTPTSMMFLDSPGTTSQTIYKVQGKTNGTGTASWGEGENEVMILVEIGT